MYRGAAMKYLFLLGFALTFVGASCASVTPLNRTCSGSTPQTAYYTVEGSCGDDGVIGVSIGSADSCVLSVSEPTAVALPTVGSFNDLGGDTGFKLAKGNWSLSDPSQGDMNVGTFLNCTSGAATATGEITLTCEENVCAPSDTDDVQCQTGGTCTAHLKPTTAPVATPDAGASPDAS